MQTEVAELHSDRAYRHRHRIQPTAFRPQDPGNEHRGDQPHSDEQNPRRKRLADFLDEVRFHRETTIFAIAALKVPPSLEIRSLTSLTEYTPDRKSVV